MKMAAPQPPALEQRFAPPTLREPLRESSPFFTPSAYRACGPKLFYLRRVTLSGVSRLCGLLWRAPVLLLRGQGGGVSAQICCLLGTCSEGSELTPQPFSVCGETEQKARAWDR